jgi:hypothetical protein
MPVIHEYNDLFSARMWGILAIFTKRNQDKTKNIYL